MESKLIAMIIGVALVLAMATATMYTQSALAFHIVGEQNGAHGDHTNNGNHFGQLANSGGLRVKPVEGW